MATIHPSIFFRPINTQYLLGNEDNPLLHLLLAQLITQIALSSLATQYPVNMYSGRMPPRVIFVTRPAFRMHKIFRDTFPRRSQPHFTTGSVPKSATSHAAPQEEELPPQKPEIKPEVISFIKGIHKTLGLPQCTPVATNPYSIFGLTDTATWEEVRKTFQKLVLHAHPDKNRDNQELATEAFKVIQDAYDVIKQKLEPKT